jgi:type II secretory pathway component HofQ
VRRTRDIRFHRASLANAARLLGEAGDFDVVVADDVGGEVSLDLRRVDPYLALVAIANARGAVVERQGRMVIVRRAAHRSAPH